MTTLLKVLLLALVLIIGGGYGEAPQDGPELQQASVHSYGEPQASPQQQQHADARWDPPLGP